MRQEGILLRLVEAVHLVDEHDGAPPARARHLCALDCFADVFHATEHGRNRDELRIETLRHQQRERGLTHTRRAPQDHRMQAARFERGAQRLAGPEQLLLADHLVERFRAQALGQRRVVLAFEWQVGLIGAHLPIVAAPARPSGDRALPSVMACGDTASHMRRCPLS